MSFVRLCNVLGRDVFSTATAGATICRFSDFGCFLGCRLSQCLCSLRIWLDIFLSGFRKDVFRLLGVDRFSCSAPRFST
ncbi:hypothetical protein ACFQJ5_17890 [Halomicroarcula sp. GCM10025324]|uniref:hypothetical protein n=1 Tax=Haloarcula TaxID=2237 RepID=UPI0023E77D4A|nr:hypothetical protein [Halomicroarcula sp. ZS-22-S1]